MREMLPELQAQLPKELGYAPANAKAIDLLDAKTKADMGIDELVKNSEKAAPERIGRPDEQIGRAPGDQEEPRRIGVPHPRSVDR